MKTNRPRMKPHYSLTEEVEKKVPSLFQNIHDFDNHPSVFLLDECNKSDFLIFALTGNSCYSLTTLFDINSATLKKPQAPQTIRTPTSYTPKPRQLMFLAASHNFSSAVCSQISRFPPLLLYGSKGNSAYIVSLLESNIS